jgi:hypothetical protein
MKINSKILVKNVYDNVAIAVFLLWKKPATNQTKASQISVSYPVT